MVLCDVGVVVLCGLVWCNDVLGKGGVNSDVVLCSIYLELAV